MNNYEFALQEAGAIVHSTVTTGSYQGDWYSHITVNGVEMFAHGTYGSCSMCDAFLSELEPLDHDFYHYYGAMVSGCPKCDEAKAAIKRLGERYIATALTKKELLKHLDYLGERGFDAYTDVYPWVKAIANNQPLPHN